MDIMYRWFVPVKGVLGSCVLVTFLNFNTAYASFINHFRGLTLLHSERPKLYTILAFLSAIG